MRPPRLAERLIALSAHPDDRETMLGDLAEELAAHVAPGRSRAGAYLWYWRQTLASTLPNVVRRVRARRAERNTEREGDGWMQTLWHDLRYAARALRKNAVFASLAIVTLALGIGATTIIYSVVDGIVLNPFPFPEAGRLVGIGPAFPKLDRELTYFESLSPAEYRDIATQSKTLERVVAWDMGNRTLAGEDAPERLFSAFWWGNAFPTLGVAPAVGRGFLQEELDRGERVAVISHRVWLRRFAGDSSVVGKRISVNGDPYTVIGVMPRRTLIYGTDLWIPMGVDPSVFPRGRRQFQVLARLAPGATLESANAEMELLARRVEREHGAELPEYAGWRLVADTWTNINVSMLRTAGYIMLAAVAFVLVLVCVNVGSLLLARAAGRRREMAVRTALGAGRGRLVRQLLTESAMLAALGGVAGVALAWWGTKSLTAVLGTLPIPVAGEVTLSTRVLAVTAVISVLSGLLFGLAPAVHASRADITGSLKAESTNATGGAARHRLQRLFVGVEVALALVLLVGGGLLVNSFLRLQRVDPGFDTRNLLTMRLTLPRERYEGGAITAFFQQLSERVSALPGVTAVGAGSHFPPVTFQQVQFEVEGQPPAGEGALPSAYVTLANDSYFRALRIPLRRGRVPNERDTENTPLVGVINEEAARRFFSGEDPVGKRITIGQRKVEIVGVVGSVKNLGLDRPPQPEIFGSIRQSVGGDNQLFLIVRAASDPRALLPLIRREVRAMDPEQPIYAVQTVDEAFATATGPRRVATMTLTLFAAFALVLAAVGIYGVVSYAVSERTREIGLRMALGAQQRQVRGLVVRQAMLPVAIGAAAGLVGAVALGRVMSGLLFEVRATDPLTIALVALLLGLVALAASYLPARRASRLDPLIALRAE
ncbi:MAG: ADOP family duplicated permease [Gemmatimonadaceae bacterium]